jgi:uncharacterized protein YggE
MKKTALCIAILTAAPLLAQAPVSPPPREAALVETISVTGSADVQLTPDRVIFSIGVDTTALTVADAVRQNNDQTARVIAALKAAGATDRDIRTSNFGIHPQYEYIEARKPRLSGYQVTNSVTVTKNTPAEAGRLLQAAIDAGANTASGLTFTVADETRGRDEGLRAAFTDARGKAQVLAQSAGRTLGRAISITEGAAQHPVPPPMPMYARGMVMAEAKQDVPVEPGSQESRFTVSVIFELR